MANIMQMMQKAQKLKGKMQELQERVQQMEMTGSSAQGKVVCRMTGKCVVKAIKIDPSLLSDGELLEDLIVAAVNDAREKAEQVMGDETQKLMKDLGLPPGLDLPF
jgi:nucleoid-associated protein EbfC